MEPQVKILRKSGSEGQLLAQNDGLSLSSGGTKDLAFEPLVKILRKRGSE